MQACGRIHQPRSVADIGLMGVAVDDHARAFADTCQEHLQLQAGTVLRLIQDHEGILEGLAAHIGQRFKHDAFVLDGALHHTASQEVRQVVALRGVAGLDERVMIAGGGVFAGGWEAKALISITTPSWS